jgi:hypothetical protein
VAAIVDRLKNALSPACLPQKLLPDPANDCEVPCLLLATLSPRNGSTCSNPGAACDPALGLGVPPQDLLNTFCDSQERAWTDTNKTGVDPATLPVCAFQQLTIKSNPGAFSNGSCKNSMTPGWCYVTAPAAGNCPQAIAFTAHAPPNVNLQCIEEAVAVVGDAAAGTATATSCQ